MEFILPKVNSENFFRYLLEDVYNLKSLSNGRPDEHNFITSIDMLPVFCGRLDLSLRDLDYCSRSMLFALKNSESRSYLNPYAVVLLVALRMKNRDLYQRFVKHECLAGEVINYIDEIIPENDPNSALSGIIANMEVELCSFNRTASEQIRLIMNQKKLTHPEYLSEKAKQKPHRIKNVFRNSKFSRDFDYQKGMLGLISSLIELVEIPSDDER